VKTLIVVFLACLLAWSCRAPEKKTPAGDSTAVAPHSDSLPSLPATKEEVTPIVDVYAGKYDRALAMLDSIFPDKGKYGSGLSAELVVKNFLNVDALDTPSELMLYTVVVPLSSSGWTHYFAVFDFSDSVKFVTKADINFSFSFGLSVEELARTGASFTAMELAPGHMAAYGSAQLDSGFNHNTGKYDYKNEYKELWGLAGGEIVSLFSFRASSSHSYVNKEGEFDDQQSTSESFGSKTAGKMCSIDLSSQPKDNDVDGTYKFDGKKYVKVSR
jgi:hypothetical protein